MSLGSDYAQHSDGFVIVHPKDTFGANDSFAYVVALDHPFNTTQAQILLVKVQSGGSESVVYSVNVSISNPSFNELANKIDHTADIMDFSPAGKYKFEVSDGTSVLAQATFMYTN